LFQLIQPKNWFAKWLEQMSLKWKAFRLSQRTTRRAGGAVGENALEIRSHLENTVTNLQAAKDSLEKGRYESAVAHAAESAFHTASALLLDEDIEPDRHEDVIISIQDVFVNRRRLTKEQGADLRWLLALRRAKDSQETVPISSHEARRAVEIAESFFKAAMVILDS
jgi:uncharacterized protein (UPF0332 family)